MAEGLPNPLRDVLRAEVEEADRAALWRGVESRRARRRRRLRTSSAMAAAAVLVLALAAGWRLGAGEAPSGPLSLRDGAPATEEVRPGARVEYDDGSWIRTSRDTSLRVLQNGASAFVLHLRAGDIEVQVTPGGPRRWVIEAGRATVEVVGTQFHVRRDGEHVGVSVSRGAVVVRHPELDDGLVRLEPGERIAIGERSRAGASARAARDRADTRDARFGASTHGADSAHDPLVSARDTSDARDARDARDTSDAHRAADTHTTPDARISVSTREPTDHARDAHATHEAREIADTDAHETASAHETSNAREAADAPDAPSARERADVRTASPAHETAGGRETTGAQGSARGAPAMAWRELAERGDYEAAYRALGGGGARQASDAASSAAELMQLADVARYSGHPADAVPPLRRLLSHHRQHASAPLAAFVLGQIELDHLERPRDAVAHFEYALRAGLPAALTGDATARLALARERMGDASGARSAACEYLERYPRGSRAAAMRQRCPAGAP